MGPHRTGQYLEFTPRHARYNFRFTSAPNAISVTPMFSHVVIFWTDPKNPNAADELIAGMEKYLRPIPGALHMHIGKMVTSPRPVVDQSYQVALNLVFANKKA